MAIATGSGACVNQPQTIPGEGGGGQGGGSSGSGSTVDPEKARELFSALEQDLLKACGACHDIGGTANTPFLKGPDRYATIVSWPGIVVKNAAESKLLTYPITGGQHLGVNIDSGDNKTTLLPKVKAWLEEEAKGIVLNQEASAGPLIEPFSPILGFNAIYLSPLGKDFEGMAVTFSANALDATTLELDDIEVHPTAKFGVHLVHPLFTVYPKGREPESDPVDSFSNVDQVFEAGQTGALGPGTVILTNWSTDAKLSLAFETIEKIDAQVDDAGTPTGGCKAIDSFNANAAPRLKQNCTSCHGGGNGSATNAVDMRNMDSDPEAACAQVKNRVNPNDPPASQLFVTTNPNGGAAHPFKFNGNAGAFDTFRTSVSMWIAAEK